MKTWMFLAALFGVPLIFAGVLDGAGLDSAGNTDGVLTWRIGTLEQGQSAREVVLLVFDGSPEKAAARLDEARKWCRQLPEPPAAARSAAEPVVWIRGAATDLALAGPGHFFWEGSRQGLTGPQGGQLSRWGYYVHYHDGAARRAGTPINDKKLENLRMVRPVQAVAKDQAMGVTETVDGKLRIGMRAILAAGPAAAVEFVLTNTSEGSLENVRLSAYTNLEAAHSHENDYSTLDVKTGGLLVVDPPSNVCVLMAGLNRPASGYSGTWPSQAQLQTAAGEELSRWQKFVEVPPSAKRQVAARRSSAVPHAPAGPSEPMEPPTVDLGAEQAADVLRADWLFQADNRPTAARAMEEIGWTRQLAQRLKKSPKTPAPSNELAELDRLQRRLEALAPDSTAEELYIAVRELKRRIAFQNPVIDFKGVLLVDNPYPRGAEWPHQARHRDGMMATPGGRLLVLEGLHPGGHVRKLAPQRPGSFWRPDLSFDAQKVLFCYKPHDESSFHLYQINFDGSGLQQLTQGPYDDLDPIYLPDGHILFSTTRSNTYVRCMPYTYAYVLARCDADGGNVYLVSRNNEPDWCPTLLNDGRVCYSRWEYHDKALWRIQSLWVMNQDGTAVATFWGNQSVWPDHLAEPRPIPGSRRVMFTGLAHHDWFAGSIGIIDPDQGFNFPHGLTKVTADVDWPECGRPPADPHETADYHASGRFAAYKTPFPLSEEDFLVSARSGGRADKFKLYLMDVYGNRELIYQGHHNVWHAMPARARQKPPQHPDRVAWPGTGRDRKPPQPGILYSADVYQGVRGLPQGIVKHVRVIQMDARTYSTWRRDAAPNLFAGPTTSIIQADGVRRILGTAPVEPDGSFAMKVPPGQALHFQLLDENYRALQTMRSFSGVMPGERRGCVGCHELHSAAPVARTGRAMKRPPSELTAPPWGTVSLGFVRHVQPLLDRYCGKCHQRDGEARDEFDLTLRPGAGVFKEPYVSLIGYVNYHRVGTPQSRPNIAGAMKAENFDQRDPKSYQTFAPMQHLSYTSRLIELCSLGKHYNVKLAPEDLRQMIAWVDANCPYRGDEEVRAIADPDFAGIESLPIRPRTKTAPVIQRP